MPRISNPIKVIFHIVLWLLLYFLNYMFTRNYAIDFEFITEFIITSTYAAIFYVNYYYLMPLLYKKKIIVYVVFTVILVSGAFYIKHNINMRRFERSHIERMERSGDSQYFKPDMRGSLRGPEHPPKDIKIRQIFMDSYGILIFFGLSFSMRFIQKWKDDEKLASDMEKEKVKTELSFLKQQINPHFLFNSLNSIYSLSLSKSDVTSDSILKLSSILRYMLYESEDSMVSLKDEISTIQDYIDLQRLRLTDKVSLNLQINGNYGGYKIIPFILIPLIENAFKYGVDNVNDSFINIVFRIRDNKLAMEVSNNIVHSKVQSSKNSGIGLKNIKRRLELLYLNEYTFDTEIVENVFKVTLELNLRTINTYSS